MFAAINSMWRLWRQCEDEHTTTEKVTSRLGRSIMELESSQEEASSYDFLIDINHVYGEHRLQPHIAPSHVFDQTSQNQALCLAGSENRRQRERVERNQNLPHGYCKQHFLFSWILRLISPLFRPTSTHIIYVKGKNKNLFDDQVSENTDFSLLSLSEWNEGDRSAHFP